MAEPANNISRKGEAQHLFALLRALPCHFGAPVQQNVAQVPDGGVYRCLKIDITIGALCAAIFVQLVNLGSHALLSPNRPAGRLDVRS